MQRIEKSSHEQIFMNYLSHENAIQGELVNLGPGAKNQTERRKCVPLAPASVYGQCRRG